MGFGPWAERESWLRAQLHPGERVIWAGQPDVIAYSLRGAWYLIPFSVVWTVFAIAWEAIAVGSGAPLLLVAWGFAFVLIGLYLVFGRLILAVREARRTAYAITDGRILIRTGAFGPRLTEIALVDLPIVQFEGQASGIGTITFGAVSTSFPAPPGWPSFGAYVRPPAFVSIRDAGRVYRILQDARAAARGA